MEWKPNKISKTEMEKKQAEYMKKAMEMAKKSIIQEKNGEAFQVKEEPEKNIEIRLEKHTQPIIQEKPRTQPIIQEKPRTQPPMEVQQIRPVLPPQSPGKSIRIIPAPSAQTQPVQPRSQSENKSQTAVLERTVIEAEVEVGFNAILTEQEKVHIKPEQEIPEKVKNYEATLTPLEMMQQQEFKSCKCDAKEIKRENVNNEKVSKPPNFNEFINTHNKSFKNEDINTCKTHGPHRRDNNCPQCNSKKNWI